MSCARCDSLSRDIAILRQEVALLSCLVKEMLASPAVFPEKRVKENSQVNLFRRDLTVYLLPLFHRTYYVLFDSH